MKLDPETREKAAEAARRAYVPNAGTPWRAMNEEWRDDWREVADAVAATIPEPTPAESPRPIDPADVRVGDRVRVVTTYEMTTTATDGTRLRDDDQGVTLDLSFPLASCTNRLYLLDRPDPDAERVAVVSEWWEQTLRGSTAKPGPTFADLLSRLDALGSYEPKPRPGDLHA